jgi:hypothetical protein
MHSIPLIATALVFLVVAAPRADVAPLTAETLQAAKEEGKIATPGLNVPTMIRMKVAQWPSGRPPSREELAASKRAVSQAEGAHIFPDRHAVFAGRF